MTGTKQWAKLNSYGMPGKTYFEIYFIQAFPNSALTLGENWGIIDNNCTAYSSGYFQNSGSPPYSQFVSTINGSEYKVGINSTNNNTQFHNTTILPGNELFELVL